MSIASEITRLQTAKANIKTAINTKGGSLTTETLDQYASVIDTISTGTDISDANALVGDVLINKTFYATSGGKKTGTMADNGTVNTDITTKAQEVTIVGGKHSGSGKVKISSTEQAKIVSDNIKSGVSILGQEGSLTPAKAEETKTITSPDFSSGNIVVTPTTDKVMTQVTVNKDTTNHTPGNIKDGITLYGVTGTYEGGGGLPSGSFVVTANDAYSFTITGANTSNDYLIIGSTTNLFSYSAGWERLYGFDVITNLSSTSFKINTAIYGEGGTYGDHQYYKQSINKIIVIEYEKTYQGPRNIENTIFGYRELTGYYFKYDMCYVRDTSIALYDNTYKPVQDITYDDNLLVWNFDNATFTSAKPLWIQKQKQALKYNHLVFSDGSELNTVNQHRIFNVEKGMFTYPMTDDTPIGTTTFNDKGEYITLVSKEIINKEVEYYNIITDYHINLFAGTILTSCRLSNLYPIVDMQYAKDNRELHNPEIFNELDDKWVSGLRLLEQPLEINRDNAVVFDNSLVDYVKRLERDKA